jgi:PAS domain S-box-containing protein
MRLGLKTREEKPPVPDLERLRHLAGIALKMNQSSSTEQAADYICREIKAIIGNGIVGATLLDPETQMAGIKALRGIEDEKLVSAALKIAGSDPRKIQISITEIPSWLMTVYNSGRLELIKGGFHTLFGEKYPASVSRALEKLLNIRFVYAMGFLNNGRNIGGVAILTDSEISDKADQAMIEIIVSHAADVITRIGIEKLEKNNNLRYKLMFESAPVAINVTKGTQITYANPAYLKMFGYLSLDYVKNLAPLELFAPECRPQILENLQNRGLGLPVPNSYESVCVRKDGTRFPVLLLLSSINFADGAATVGFVMDISERKLAEAELQTSLAEKEVLLNEIRRLQG